MPVRSQDSSDENIQQLDSLYAQAGLVRHRHGGHSPVKRARSKPVDKEELFRPAEGLCRAENGVEWLAVPEWKKLNWLWHGFSTRKGGRSRAYCAEDAPGELNLGYTAHDDRKAVAENRRLFAEAVSGSRTTPLVTVRQVHSSVVVTASARDAGRDRPRKADGVMTGEPGILLGVQTADCVPVLVADRRLKVVAAFHAGWRGTAKRIVEGGIGRMRLEFGSRPEDLIAAVGPAVGACCYAVGEEVFSEFESQFAYAGELFQEVYDTGPVRTKYPMLFLTQRAPGHSPLGPSLHLDLQEANRRQLLDAGLKPDAVRMTRGCTCCQRELFFSHRGSEGRCGRMLSVIGIRR